MNTRPRRLFVEYIYLRSDRSKIQRIDKSSAHTFIYGRATRRMTTRAIISAIALTWAVYWLAHGEFGLMRDCLLAYGVCYVWHIHAVFVKASAENLAELTEMARATKSIVVETKDKLKITSNESHNTINH